MSIFNEDIIAVGANNGNINTFINWFEFDDYDYRMGWKKFFMFVWSIYVCVYGFVFRHIKYDGMNMK